MEWVSLVRAGVRSDQPQRGRPPVEYMPATRPSLVASRSRGARQLRDDLGRYDPKREVVVAFFGARDEKAMRAGKLEEFSGVLPQPTKDSVTSPQAYDIFVQVHGEVPG
jgi:hypothetical protein